MQPNMPVPTIGRIVHYTLTAAQAADINRRRRDARERFERERQSLAKSGERFAHGGQFHVGNTAYEGEVFPMLITQVWGGDPTSYVNGQVFLDGNDVLWATSVKVGTGPGTFAWPERPAFMVSPGLSVTTGAPGRIVGATTGATPQEPEADGPVPQDDGPAS